MWKDATPGNHRQIFLGFHYGELKDLGKHFLTVIVGVLAFSVTLSDNKSGRLNGMLPILLLMGWTCLFGAAVCTGTGIYSNYIAGAKASGAIIGGVRSDFKHYVRRTYRLYQLGGGLFVLGCLLLVAAAIVRMT